MSLASKANTLKEQLGLEDGLPIVAIVDQAAVQLGITEEAGPLPIVEKCDLCLSELGNPRQPVSQEAAERCAEISKQLGYAEGTPLAMVVSQAETDLGLGGNGLDLVQRCNRVCETLGIGGSSSARPALAGPIAPVPATMAGEIVVLEGIAVTTPEAPASLGVFTFSSCTNNAFDTNGVLYALGTDFGRAHYTNSADSGKVRLGWSWDAANYYSTAGGHKLGDATQAARIICAHTHPGANATMWSRGKNKAWFSIDLVSIELRPTHFAYRNDYGGGGNHPRSFELQGSSDGRSWSTLSVHSSEGWSGKQAKAWPLHGHSQYYRMLRIQNKGAPKHLCCSGIEFYGEVRPAPAAPPPPSGPLRVIEARYGWAPDLWNVPELGSGHRHGGGAKDVTSVVRGLVSHDELHINPHAQGQYMNRTFWPETAGGPPIPRKLAVRYAYGDGPEQTVETPALPHETVALHVTRDGPRGLIQTKDIEGCWVCCCFPLLPLCALYKMTATGPDSYKKAGVCFPLLIPFLPSSPLEEHRQRCRCLHSSAGGRCPYIPYTCGNGHPPCGNRFHNVGEPDTVSSGNTIFVSASCHLQPAAEFPYLCMSMKLC